MRLQHPYSSPTTTIEFGASTIVTWQRIAPDIVPFGKRDKTSKVATTGRTHMGIKLSCKFIDVDGGDTATKQFFDLDDLFGFNEKSDWKFQIKGTDGTYTNPRFSAKVRIKSIRGELMEGRPNIVDVDIQLEVKSIDSYA